MGQDRGSTRGPKVNAPQPYTRWHGLRPSLTTSHQKGGIGAVAAKDGDRCGSVTQVKPATGCNGPIPGATKR